MIKYPSFLLLSSSPSTYTPKPRSKNRPNLGTKNTCVKHVNQYGLVQLIHIDIEDCSLTRNWPLSLQQALLKLGTEKNL